MRSVFNDLDDRDGGTLANQLARQKQSEINDLLAAGWTIKSESGRQVILTRDGQTITRYRPKK